SDSSQATIGDAGGGGQEARHLGGRTPAARAFRLVSADPEADRYHFAPGRRDNGPPIDDADATRGHAAKGVRGRGPTQEGDARMAAMKPRTGDGPLEVTKEGRGIVMRVPLEGGGRLVVELSADEAKELGDAIKEVVG